VPPNPHDPGGRWGGVSGEGQIAGSAEGGAGSGRRGTIQAGPWTGPRFPRMHVFDGQGTGYAAFKNMHIRWTVKVNDVPATWVYSGEITQ
jgi:hypothetical protein